jgi:hypothetical protein
MAKFKLNLTATEKALLEHYGYGVVAAGYAAYQIDPHATVKQIIIEALVGGLLAPLLARINPKSLVNTITKDTGAPAPLVQAGVDAVLADANKIVAAETPKAK